MADLDLALAGMHTETRLTKKTQLLQAGKVIGHTAPPSLRQPPKYTDLVVQRQAQNVPGRISAVSGASATEDVVRVDDMLLMLMTDRGIRSTEGDNNTLSLAQWEGLRGAVMASRSLPFTHMP